MNLKHTLALTAVGTYCMINPPFAMAATDETVTPPLHVTGEHVPEPVEATATETAERTGIKIGEFATLSGIIEVDATLGENFERDTSSSIDLATAELYLDLEATEWARSRFAVEYDSDDDDLALIEANITLGGADSFPFFLTAGRVYAPFGDFSTNMLQDPLTLTVGEINSTGVIAGFTAVGLTGTVFGFKGLKETDSDDTVQGFGASLGYSYEQDETAVNAGISWVNNIADADAVTEAMDESGLDGITSRVDGFGMHLGASCGPFSLIGEYIMAVDSFDPAELAFGESGARPAAWNGELAYTTQFWAKETVFAAGYQQSSDALALGLPEQRYIAAASIEVFAGTTVSLEYYLDQDYDAADGGTGEDGYGLTTRLAYVF